MSIFDWVLGKPLTSGEEESQQIGPVAGIPVLGLDALSSAAYGPEAALTILLPLGALGLRYIGPISGLIIGVLLLVYFSYRQTISAYPGGGGSYTVAKENLGRRAALMAAAALALDYVLNVAVGISAGVGALVSAAPALLPHTLALCLAILVLLTMINLRGLREAGFAFTFPTYAFVLTLGAVIAIGLWKALTSGGHPVPVVAPPMVSGSAVAVGSWMLVRAFASGCTAMTGVEAVSNGVPIFREPRVSNAQRTLTAIVAILVLFLAGIAYLAHSYGLVATDPGAASYQSLLSMLVGAVVGRGAFYYVTLGSVVAVLCLSANTSFADFPRLCRILAEDQYLPDFFALRGRRLVFTQGILALAILAGSLLVVFGGITDRLIPLFAIGAFLAFTLSQAAMVVHWRRIGGSAARHSLPLNAIGAVATAITLVVVAVSKFSDGAWLTLILIPVLVYCFFRINHHYLRVSAQIELDRPLSCNESKTPIVVVCAQSWNTLTERGLQFAMRLSPDVHAVQVRSELSKMKDLSLQWDRLVAEPAHAAGLPAPSLQVLNSTYRHFFVPFLDFVLKLGNEHPHRDVVVVIPDLVVAHWWEGLLHNNRGEILRALLRRYGGPRLVVVNTPIHLTS
jgi:amino acid transporter